MGLGLGFGLENKERSKEDQRHYQAFDGKLGHHSLLENIVMNQFLELWQYTVLMADITNVPLLQYLLQSCGDRYLFTVNLKQLSWADAMQLPDCILCMRIAVPISGLHGWIWLPLCSSRVFFLFFPSLEISPNFCHQYIHVSNMRVTAGNWPLMVHSTCHVSFDCQRYGN